MEIPLRLQIEEGAPTLQLSGDLDMATAPLLAEALGRHGEQVVCLDMRGVGFLDSAGAHALVEAARRLGDRGCLILHAPRPGVARVFELLSLTDEASNVHVLDGHASS